MATLGVAAVGGAVASPVLLCGAAAIAGLTGWSVYRDWKAGEKLDKLELIEKWLQKTALRTAQANVSLEQVLIYALDENSDARDALPDGVGQDHLGKLLAIIQAEGEDRKKLLHEQKMMVEALRGTVIQYFEQINKRFDLQEADLAIIRRDARKAASGIEFLEWLLLNRESPPLRLPSKPLDDSTRFIYSARRVTMRGRTAEMDELAAFLDAEGTFRWAAWTALAGMGKSRLALEFCDRAAELGWEVGFYDWRVQRKPAWDTWVPSLPTLIVFDYVQEHAQQISTAIATLASQAEGLSRKVRFLLLERPAPEVSGLASRSWWQTLLSSAHENDAAAIASSCHYHDGNAPLGKPRPRSLEGIDRESVKEVLNEIASKGGLMLDDAELDRQLAQLEAVSPDRRPLYVALAAEAIDADDMRPDWDAQDLTRYVLNKERGRWEAALKAARVPDTDQPRWIRLLLLATMCDGLTIKSEGPCIFDDETLAGWVPTIASYSDGSTLAIVAPGATGTTLPKLEPDMLGELFVLEEFNQRPREDKTILAAAWRYDALGFTEFCLRAANSFPKHANLDCLLRIPEDLITDGDVRHGLAFALSHAVYHRGSDFERADRMLQRLRTLNKGYPEDAKVREALAFALITTVRDHSGSDFERADRMLQELCALNNEHPEDTNMRRLLAAGLGHAVHLSGSDFERADRLLQELRTLNSKHHEDADVRMALAFALSITDYGHSSSDLERADRMLQELRTLNSKHHEDAGIRQMLTIGLSSAVYDHNGSDFERHDQLLHELRMLRDEHPEDDNVREGIAMGLNNAIYHSGPDLERTDCLLHELRMLKEDHPKDASIRHQLSRGLKHAVSNSGSDFERRDQLLHELRMLRDEHPEDDNVREALDSALGDEDK